MAADGLGGREIQTGINNTRGGLAYLILCTGGQESAVLDCARVDAVRKWRKGALK